MSLDAIIKDLEKFIKYLDKNLKDPKADDRYNYAISIVKYLKKYTDYEIQKQINDEYKKINAELREKVKKLESEIDGQVYWGSTPTKEIEKMWIPKQKIKDLIKKEKLPLTTVGGRKNAKTLGYVIKLGKIKAYEELLQESEDK